MCSQFEMYWLLVSVCSKINYNKLYALHRLVAEFDESNLTVPCLEPRRASMAVDIAQQFGLAHALLERRRLISDSSQEFAV
jgi:hypothetical protein